jgi:hypothetical protein
MEVHGVQHRFVISKSRLRALAIPSPGVMGRIEGEFGC